MTPPRIAGMMGLHLYGGAAKWAGQEQEMAPMSEAQFYEIQIQGHLSSQWADWFDGLWLENRPDGTAVLSGAFPDQARLFGVLDRLRDLGLTLIAVNRRQA